MSSSFSSSTSSATASPSSSASSATPGTEKLAALQATYEAKLVQYREAMTTYIDGQRAMGKPVFGKAWQGAHAIGDAPADSVDICGDMCAGEPGCDGANFRDSDKHCYMRAGLGDKDLLPAAEKDAAILTTQTIALETMAKLNDALRNLTVDILKELNTAQQTKPSQKQVRARIEKQHAKLVEQRAEMARAMADIESLTAVDRDTKFLAVRSDWMGTLWLIAAVLAVLCALSTAGNESSHVLLAFTGILLAVWLLRALLVRGGNYIVQQ